MYHQGARRQYIGKPVVDMDYVWGDDESIINIQTVPEIKLNKRHNALFFTMLEV